jgi:TRAP-type C4-dicarboxylate transport system permease large subunit
MIIMSTITLYKLICQVFLDVKDIYRYRGQKRAKRLPGGLLHANLVGGSVFATVTCSSFATLATIGKMIIPELKRRKYSH